MFATGRGEKACDFVPSFSTSQLLLGGNFSSLSKTVPIFIEKIMKDCNCRFLFFASDDFLFRIEKGKGVMMMMMMMTRVGSIEPITQLGWIIIKERRGKL